MQNQCGIKSSVGNIWMNTGSWTGASITLADNTYKEIGSLSTSFTLSSYSTDFAMTTDGRLKYTGIDTKLFSVTSFINFNNSARFSSAIYKNGVLISDAQSYSNGSSVSINKKVEVYLSTDDYISLWLKRFSGTNITVYEVILGAASKI